MQKSDLIIRPATPADARFVAWTVLTALDLPLDTLDKTEQSCADERSMYSWANALVACDGDRPVGCIVSYPGDLYADLRRYTWARLWDGMDLASIDSAPAETGPGEYYLDSLAILPEYRGAALGRRLMQAAMDRGRALGYTRFSLLVSVDKPHLRDYYAATGFTPLRTIPFFGHLYHAMQSQRDITH